MFAMFARHLQRRQWVFDVVICTLGSQMLEFLHSVHKPFWPLELTSSVKNLAAASGGTEVLDEYHGTLSKPDAEGR